MSRRFDPEVPGHTVGMLVAIRVCPLAFTRMARSLSQNVSEVLYRPP